MSTTANAPKNFLWQIAKVVGISILGFWALAICLGVLGFSYIYFSQAQIDSVSFDESSEWCKYFLSKSGFSTIRICSHFTSRQYVDYISIVGSDRPKSWFEQLGFEQISDDDEGYVHTIANILPNDGSTQRLVVMRHPMLPHKTIFYLPKAGILIYQEP